MQPQAADTRRQRVRELSQTPITDRQADWLAKKLRWWFAWMDHKKTADHKTFSYLDYKAGGFKNADEVAATGLLKKTGWSRADGLQRGWILTPAGQATHEALADVPADRTPKPTPAPIAAPRPRGRPRTRAVDRYSKTGRRADDIDTLTIAPAFNLEHARATLDHNRALSKESRANIEKALEGEISFTYRQDNHGRLQNEFQNFTKQAKAALLPDCFDIDIESCHPTILQQLARQHGIDDTPTLDDLINNKKRWRGTLAKHCNADIDDIKACLTSLLFDARITAAPRTAIHDRLGTVTAKRFTTHPDVIELHAELKYLTRYIVRRVRKAANRSGNIKNALGLPIHKTAKPNQIISHLCTGIEQQIKRTIASQLVNVQVDMHDGLIVREAPTTERLKEICEHVKKITGFVISLDVEPLNAGYKAVEQYDKGATAQVSADFPALPFQPEYLKELEAGHRQQDHQPLTERCSDNSLFHVIITAINFGNTHTENCTEIDGESENTPRTTGPPHTAPPDRV